MPPIYLENGPFHHDMRDVPDLRPVWFFAVPPKQGPISLSPPPIGTKMKDISFTKVGYRRFVPTNRKTTLNCYRYDPGI